MAKKKKPAARKRAARKRAPRPRARARSSAGGPGAVESARSNAPDSARANDRAER